MKIESGIRVVRTPYEEPYHTQITITASNGLFTGETDLYCGVDELIEIGQALARFPTKVPDEYEFMEPALVRLLEARMARHLPAPPS